MSTRQCPFCGKLMPEAAQVCPHCRETMPEERPAKVDWKGVGGSADIRRGLMYMWLSALIYYFTAGYSPLELTFDFLPILNDYLLPLMFLGGLGLTAYGLYRSVTA
jgi:hypothetical protein